MCGICGILNVDAKPVDPGLIDRMCRCLAHRGPDDHGIYTGDGVGLGHRRLSIIDLSPDGRQPMANEDGSIRIVFNGEVYNFKALRHQLEQKGHVFKSRTDTEAILHLYEEHGIDAVHHLNGMFAFALWDRNRRRLWLCRDRVGVKPLVYHWDGNNLRFASEIKALLQDSAVPRRIDHEALNLYLAFSYIPAPLTIYKGIAKLPPGHHLIVEDGKPRLQRYWDAPGIIDRHGPQMPFAEQKKLASRDLFKLVEDAVTLRMIADVPLGAFLSGGIDSSVVVAMMARHSSRPVQTFSIGFSDMPLYDETGYAREVSRFWRTEHHLFTLTSTVMLDVMEDVLGALDEPFSDSSVIPTFIVSRQTRGHVKVALSGDGGDELFAGYRSYLAPFWHRLFGRLPGWVVEGGCKRLLDRMPEARDSKWLEWIRLARKFLRASKKGQVDRILALMEIFPADQRHRLLAPFGGQDGQGDPAREHLAALLRRRAHTPDDLELMLYADFADSLPGDMLTRVDWMSMRHGLEVRTPLLDYRLVEWAFQLPNHLKISRGQTKYIFKETFKDLLPPLLHNRPKRGFEVPISRWIRKELRFLLDKYLAPARLRRQGLFDHRAVSELIQAHLSKRADTSWMLWNLIVFQHWYETWMDKKAV